MTFLSGKTTSYTRWISDLPDLFRAMDDRFGAKGFSPLLDGNHDLERIGTCSWRNLLDGPVDRGLLDGDPDFYAVGLRRDVKRAPGQLVKAETARAVADYLQTCGGKPSKARIREIGKEVREDLHSQAKARPSHGIAVVNPGRGLVLVDGPSGVHSWLSALLNLRPLYEEAPARFLEWLIWSGLHEDHEQGHAHCWPEQQVVFRDPEGAGYTLQGVSAAHGLENDLENALSSGAKVHSARFRLVLGDDTCSLTLNRAWLKVSSLEFPEDCGKTGPLESRLLERMRVVEAVEAELGRLVVEYLGLVDRSALAPEFLAMLPDSEVEAGPEVVNG